MLGRSLQVVLGMHAGPVFRGIKHAEELAQRFLGRVALHGLGPAVPGRDDAMRVHQEDGGFLDFVDHQTEHGVHLGRREHGGIQGQRHACLMLG
jgi:hypothetical protein